MITIVLFVIFISYSYSKCKKLILMEKNKDFKIKAKLIHDFK